MVDPPQSIRSLTDQRVFELQWSGVDVCRLPYRLLREECPCAACVDEVTGRRILDITTIPDDIRPMSVSFAGNYALKVRWSDSHDTGLFTWNLLAALCGHSAADSSG